MPHVRPVNLGRIYTTSTPPRLWSDDIYEKSPLRVILNDEENEPLPSDAQINYGEPCYIEHDAKVVDVGLVEPHHHRLLLNYFMESTRNEDHPVCY